jgi:hypothetical protein
MTKTKSPLIYFSITVIAIALLTLFGPEEKSLGSNVRIVYLHGAWVMAAEVAFIAAQLAAGADLNFQIAGRQLQRRPRFAQQNVGQDRQGVATLHDARNGLQNGQNFVLRCLQYDHVNLCCN